MAAVRDGVCTMCKDGMCGDCTRPLSCKCDRHDKATYRPVDVPQEVLEQKAAHDRAKRNGQEPTAEQIAARRTYSRERWRQLPKNERSAQARESKARQDPAVRLLERRTADRAMTELARRHRDEFEEIRAQLRAQLEPAVSQ